MVTWESLFGTATSATDDITIPTGTPVVLHGCAQFNSTVNVRSITVPVGATVSFSSSRMMCMHRAVGRMLRRIWPASAGLAANPGRALEWSNG